MVGKWLVVLPLLVEINIVSSQSLTLDSSEVGARRLRQLDPADCCPCPDARVEAGARSSGYGSTFGEPGCSCQPRADDAEAAASIFMPALKAIQPFVKQAEQKAEPKPLLQPEVGLASSVLETLRQATDEEYQDALARDAARAAVKVIESTLDPSAGTLSETPRKVVKIFLNPKEDDMDDNLPEQSHVQETRCIHSPLQSVHRNPQVRISRPILESFYKNERVNQPARIIEVIDIPRTPTKKLKSKGLLHRNQHDMDSGIGASNIQERVVQPSLTNANNLLSKSNPALFGLLENSNVERNENIVKTNGGLSDLNQKSTQKLNYKLREFIENLDLKSNKEKPKLPAIDLKKYFSTTRSPPLKLKQMEKPINRYKPLLLKDILKLKDVELIPRKDLTKKVAEKPFYPNLKFQSGSKNTNLESDDCNENIINKPPTVLGDVDAEISPSNIQPIFESKNDKTNFMREENEVPDECILSSEISDTTSNRPKDLVFESNSDYGDTDNVENPNNDQLSLDNCDTPTGNNFKQNILNSENQNRGSNTNEFQTEQVQNFQGNSDMLNEGSNNDVYQIDFVEDLELPVEFDNSSFISTSDLVNDNTVNHLVNADNIQKTLKNYIDNTRVNDIQIKTRHDEVDDCISREELHSMEQESLENKINLSHNPDGAFSDTNEDPNQVNFKDLQDMSDSILRVSECGISLDNGISNSENTEPETSIREKADGASNIPGILSSESETEPVFNINSKENICQTSLEDGTSAEMGEAEIREGEISNISDKKNLDMNTEASEPESISISEGKSDDCEIKSSNTVDAVKNNNIFDKAKSHLSNILQGNIQTDFLNSVKSKLNGVFTTTEKNVLNDVLSNPEDNINESSNMNPIKAKYNQFRNSENLKFSPQSLIGENSPFRLPLLPLEPKSRLTVPKFDHPLFNNLQNFETFPLESPGLFENALDPSLSIAALTDRLRSHTEETIQNVKDTLESKMRESQSLRLSQPTKAIDTQDVLESLSSRRDDMKDKLEAIHLDFNDRLSSFHQNIVDHFSQPTNEIASFQKESSNGRQMPSNIPKRKQLFSQDGSKLRKVKDGPNLLEARANAAKNEKKTHFQNSERKAFPQNPTTTSIPSFVPRPKVLKTNMDMTPKLNSENLPSRGKITKFPNLLEPKVKKPGQTNDFSKTPGNSIVLPRNNMPLKKLKTNKEKLIDDSSEDSPVDKFRKTLLQRAQNQKSRNEKIKNNQRLITPNYSLDSGVREDSGKNQEDLLRRLKSGGSGLRSRNNNEMIVSPSSQVGSIQKEDGFRLVEPMKENVPYKCKLICYQDT